MSDESDRDLVLSDIEELVSLLKDNLKDFDFDAMQENAECLLESLVELEGWEDVPRNIHAQN